MLRVTESFVRDVYEDFTFGRLDRLNDVLDKRVDFISQAPAEFFPYLGRRLGREETLEALAQTHKVLEVINFWPLTVLIDGDNAALTVFIQVKERRTQKFAQFVAAHFITFQNGKIIKFYGVLNSYDAVHQLFEKSRSAP